MLKYSKSRIARTIFYQCALLVNLPEKTVWTASVVILQQALLNPEPQDISVVDLSFCRQRPQYLSPPPAASSTLLMSMRSPKS